jgi:tRNA acetyltransferase TAN1
MFGWLTMYDFNLLVSCPWPFVGEARREIAYFFRQVGDEKPAIKLAVARGIIGVKTRLDSREVIKELKVIFSQDPNRFQHTLKWIPVDLWTHSDIESMRKAVKQVKDSVRHGERWRMTVEKRRYTLHHKVDIITRLAELIEERVDLTNPDEILRIDIVGKFAGVSVILPNEVFTTTRLNLIGS